eukprot:2392558-Pleurochrysis_carterae.AAC.2
MQKSVLRRRSIKVFSPRSEFLPPECSCGVTGVALAARRQHREGGALAARTRAAHRRLPAGARTQFSINSSAHHELSLSSDQLRSAQRQFRIMVSVAGAFASYASCVSSMRFPRFRFPFRALFVCAPRASVYGRART